MSHPLAAVGGATFEILGLNPGEFDYAAEASWPSDQIAGRGPLYQATGLGERVLTIAAMARPHVTGGLGSYAALKALMESQQVVPFVRLGANLVGEVAGAVFVRHLRHREGKQAPDGVGYKHEFEFELVFVDSLEAGGW